VLLTAAPEGGWGLGGHANTNAELVSAARAQIAELGKNSPDTSVRPSLDRRTIWRCWEVSSEYRGRVTALWSMALVGSTPIGLSLPDQLIRPSRLKGPGQQPWPSSGTTRGKFG
jgi:hypothetical protein